MSPEKIEIAQDDGRSRWVFPDDYLDDMVAKHTGIVRASTDPTRLLVTEPIRLHISDIYPELDSDKVAKLTSLFLNAVRKRRRGAGRTSTVMPMSGLRKSKKGGSLSN